MDQQPAGNNVIALPRQGRSTDVIAADFARAAKVVCALFAEFEAANNGTSVRSHPKAALEPELLCLKRAAAEVGFSVKTLRRHVVRHNNEHPRDPLGFQPGGLPNSPWRIDMPRLRRYVHNCPSEG